MSQQSLLVALPVAVFLGVALVVLLLAFGEPDLTFGPAILPVQRQRNGRVALALHGADEVRNFTGVKQQFAGALGVGLDVGGGGL